MVGGKKENRRKREKKKGGMSGSEKSRGGKEEEEEEGEGGINSRNNKGNGTDGDKQERPLGSGAVENLRQELHRAGRVRERHEPGHVRCGEEQAHGDADGLVDVVDLVREPFGRVVLHELEHDDQPRGGFKERLLPVGAGRRGVQQPLPVRAPS